MIDQQQLDLFDVLDLIAADVAGQLDHDLDLNDLDLDLDHDERAAIEQLRAALAAARCSCSTPLVLTRWDERCTRCGRTLAGARELEPHPTRGETPAGAAETGESLRPGSVRIPKAGGGR